MDFLYNSRCLIFIRSSSKIINYCSISLFYRGTLLIISRQLIILNIPRLLIIIMRRDGEDNIDRLKLSPSSYLMP